ncbi:MAG TPA: 4'-phosphopantetheinyl transferase superfamily protein [Natronosporangium sp.]
MAAVEVWWGRPSAELPWHAELLDAVERERRSSFRRAEDQARFTVATAVLKLVAARRLGADPGALTIDRTCDDCGRPHGRPRLLPDTGLAVSISHSGDRVAVALTEAGAVGVDVEEIRPFRLEEMAGHVLGDGETAADLPAFFGYWTRKEAVVKATGDGLRMPLSKVVVTHPDTPPALLRYGERTDLPARLADLAAGDGYRAAVAVLSRDPVRVEPRDATGLLTAA